MKITYRLLRAFGIIGAIWIITELFAGYGNLRAQMNDISFSPASQENQIWAFFITGALPYGVIALLLLLPYGLLPRSLRLVCAVALCCALGFIVWSFLRPFVTISGIHLTAMPSSAWVHLIGYLFFLPVRLSHSCGIKNWSNKALQLTATRR
jgi:hypothetical protein